MNGGLCAFLFFHVMYLQPQPALLHLLVASTVVGFFGACLARGWDITPDVALSVMGFVWGMVAIQFNRPIGRRILSMLRLPLTEDEESVSARALVGWAVGMTGVAVAITLPIYWMARPDFPNLSVTLLLSAVTCLSAGVRWRNVYSTTAAAILFPASLAATAVIYIDPLLLRDLAGLATAGLAFAYVMIEFVVRRRASLREVSDTYARDVSKSLIKLAHGFAAIAVVITVASMTVLTPFAHVCHRDGAGCRQLVVDGLGIGTGDLGLHIRRGGLRRAALLVRAATWLDVLAQHNRRVFGDRLQLCVVRPQYPDRTYRESTSRRISQPDVLHGARVAGRAAAGDTA